MWTTVPTQYSSVSLCIQFPILYHQTCHFSELQRCPIIFSNLKFLKLNLASFLCALALVLQKLKHYHSNASVSLTTISCARSPSFTLVPQIYVKCRLPSLSFSNLSLPFHSCFRPSSGTICFKSGHIVILTVLSLRSPIYIIQHPKAVFQTCYHSITSYFKTSKGSLFPLW